MGSDLGEGRTPLLVEMVVKLGSKVKHLGKCVTLRWPMETTEFIQINLNKNNAQKFVR